MEVGCLCTPCRRPAEALPSTSPPPQPTAPPHTGTTFWKREICGQAKGRHALGLSLQRTES